MNARAALRMSETEFQRAVVDLARLCRWRLRYHTHDSRRSPSGFPDLVLVRPPRIVFAELKTELGTLTDDQRAWLDGLTGVPGLEVHLWRPNDWPYIEEVLR